MSTITPTPGNIVLKVVEEKEKTKSGLFLPSDARGLEFIVLAVHLQDSTGFNEGDRVLINQKNAVTLSVEGQQILVVPAKDILAVIS